MVIHMSVPAVAQTTHQQDVTQAEELINAGQLDLALQLYIQILERYTQRSSQEMSKGEQGKIHLRLAQLYHKKVKLEPTPEVAFKFEARSAYHFLLCSQSEGLSSILREDICKAQVQRRLKPLQVKGKVEKITVRHPAPFQGPIKPGGLLPKGMVSLEIIVSKKRAPEYRVVSIPQTQPLVFYETDYMPSRPQMKNPAGLVFKPEAHQQGFTRAQAQSSSNSSHVVRDLPTTPGYVMLSLGLASFIAGSVIHFGDFDDKDIAAGKSRSVTWSMISGTTLTTLGGGWIAFTW
jgi:hypothetical protein